MRQWFADQDIHKLRGPTNPSLNYELGLLVDGFDSPPTFMMTYNPPYYARLVENYGFRKTQDLYAFWGHVAMLPAIAAKLGPVAEQIIERYNVKLRPLDTARFQEDVETFLSIYNRSLVNTWGFVPMSADEVRHMADGLRQIIVPEMAIAAEIDGRVVGASFGLPDYNPRIKEIDGRLFPFGFMHLLRNRRAIKRIRLISTNVLPEYQRMGVGLVLLYGLVPKAMEWGLEEAEFSWVLESNRLSYGALKKGARRSPRPIGCMIWRGAEERGEAESEIGEGEGGRWDTESEGIGHVEFPACMPIPTSSSHPLSISPLVESARSAAGATSTVSSGCRGGSTPQTRTGSRPCWSRSRRSSTAASIPSTSTATPRSSWPCAAGRPSDASWSAMTCCTTSSPTATSAASACSSASTTARRPMPCWTPPPAGSVAAAGRASWARSITR